MKLDYAGGEVLISDAMSHALLEYSASIARTGGSENLLIPVFTLDGVQGMAEIVVGPASQLIATPTEQPHVDLGDQSVVDDIIARTTLLRPARAIPVAGDDVDTAESELP